jgi:hypothetical protein
MGGKVYTSHYGWEWLQPNASLASAAAWNTAADIGAETSATGTLQTTNPRVANFASWMNGLGALATASPATVTLPSTVHHTANGVLSPTVSWIDGTDPNEAGAGGPQEILFTFDTPVGSTSTCGRVAYAAFHTDTTVTAITSATVFPSECSNVPATMSVQDRIFEYMLWDLAGSTCVAPSASGACTPRTCAAQGIACGPAGDGCGGQLNCGTCATGTCGGGGFSKCG